MSAQQKVAVITGAAAGIGLASARRLAQKGYALGLADLSGPALDALAAEWSRAGQPAIILPGDVSEFATVTSHCQAVIQRFGRIDVLVNNAGISQPKTILEITEAEWDRTLAVNLKGVFNWCKAVAPHMVQAQYGRIINMSSVSAGTGGAPSAVSKFAYCASKAGILGLTRALAKELAPHVTVNAICPGSIRTNLTEQLIATREEAIRQSVPLNRVGTPDDVAVVVEFLATMEPCYMTGEILDVDGGQWVN
ncbi:SDR family NAD(P)-dependent oxidoreductase [Rhodoligotrophos ferricapiens]|uniref:SDR family NAD(P)-dependent oxidoreductase n=1 Tax=Rhodoligotrophos ferricapiens TaxID=3069264 RepID=UPI00315C8694